jgi:hypothetical protein
MPAYKVVRADPRADRATIIDLLVRNEPDMPRQADQVAWHFERNPHGEGRCWLLLAEPAGKPIGTTGIVMRRVQVNGEIHMAGRTWGVSVDREHRTLGPALQLARAAIAELERDVSFLFVLPYTRVAGSLFSRAGYRKVGDLDRHVRVLRCKHYLQHLAEHPRFQHPLLQHPSVQRALASGLADLLAAPADLGTRLAFDRPWQRPRDLVLHCVRGFDHRFDDLWQRGRPLHQVTSERSSDFLGWRFRRSWDTHLVLGFSPPGEEERRLAGYAVLAFHRHQAIIEDLFLEEPSALAGPAVWLLLEWVRSHGFESACMALAGCTALRRELQRHWFLDTTRHEADRKVPRPAPGTTRPAGIEPPPDELLVAVSKSKEGLLPGIDSWYFTVADDV